MKISYNWLKEMLPELPSVEKVEHTLTFGAFEVEGKEEVHGDTVLEVKILANRAGDCLSHRGIAKELSALLGISLKDPFEEKLPKVAPSPELAVHVEDKTLCTRYIGALVKGVKVGPSPEYIRQRLEALGARSINNIVDITNYVMLETGQPLHAFDAGKLEKKDGAWNIGVRSARQGESITTLTGEEYVLHTEDLLIVDGNSDKAIGIAGIKGGKLAEIAGATADIVVESANFSWLRIRKSSQRLKLKTDASYRFEHNLSPHLAEIAMARVLALILKHAGGALSDLEDTSPNQPSPAPVAVTAEKISSVLGISVSDKDVERTLGSLGFGLKKKGEEWQVSPPAWRGDITLGEDLAEEIGRLIGYDKVPAQPLPDPMREPAVHAGFAHEILVRKTLLSLGYSEVLTSVFTDKKEGEIELENPNAEDRPKLRRHIAKPGLESALSLNVRNAPLFAADVIRVFEMGTVFSREGEHLSLALGVAAGKKSEQILNETAAALENALGVPLVHDMTHGRDIREYNLTETFKKLSEPDRPEHLPLPEERRRYKAWSPYPFVLRDIAVWVPESVDARMVASRIVGSGGPLLVRHWLFDEFKRDDQKSYAFHLVFLSHEKTLTTADVNEHMANIEQAMKKSGWSVR